MIKKMLTTSLMAVAILAACSLQSLPPLPTRQTPQAIAALSTTNSTTVASTTATAEESVPREFVERLIGYFAFGSSEVIELELLIGKLPPDLTFLPIPKEATVLGSVVRGDIGSEAILDTKQDAKAVLAFYADQLKASGWTTPTVNMMGPGGFVPVEQTASSYFCKSQEGPTLLVNARELKEGITDVRLTYMTSKGMGFGFGPCNIPSGAATGPPFQLPNLIPPQDVRQAGGGSGGSGPDRFWTSTMLVTTMTVTSIQDHYAAQLEKVGWTLGDTGSSGPVAWSWWTSKSAQGKPQNGLLFVLEEGKETPQRFVYLQVSVPGSSSGVVRETLTQLVRSAP